MSPKIPLFLVLLGVATAVSMVGEAQAGRIKCWTNNEGVRECGNTVPPEYAQKGHTEKSDAGITTKVTKRAKTKEELEIAAAEKAEQQAREREEARLAAIQAEKDRVLLSTYTTQDDLILARDGKLAAIDSRINHSRQVTHGLERKLEALQDKAAKRERGGKKVDPELMAEIAGVKHQIEGNKTFILARNNEKGEITAAFDADLTRWLKLKGR